MDLLNRRRGEILPVSPFPHPYPGCVTAPARQGEKVEFYGVGPRAAESESRPELKSVGVDRFARSQSRNCSWQNFADSDSGPESQDTTRQQPMILDEQFCIVPKT